jgi:hypothetical protein
MLPTSMITEYLNCGEREREGEREGERERERERERGRERGRERIGNYDCD